MSIGTFTIMSKTIYYANHDNIKGNQLIRVNEFENIFNEKVYEVELETCLGSGSAMRECLKRFNDRFKAIRFANDYQS